MTDILLESRRGLRQRAFQALMSLEYEGDLVEACRFAYSYDKDEEADKVAEADIPAFLLNLTTWTRKLPSTSKRAGQWIV